jgi:SRSO17 transposase
LERAVFRPNIERQDEPEIALAEIDRVIARGVRFGCVLADAGYGLSAPFRQGVVDQQNAVGIKDMLSNLLLVMPPTDDERNDPKDRHCEGERITDAIVAHWIHFLRRPDQ